MVPGMPNAYELIPLSKMMVSSTKQMKFGKKITYVENSWTTFSVLYNPQTLKISRSMTSVKDASPGEKKNDNENPPQKTGQNANNRMMVERLQVDLFVDTISAGSEIYGATDLWYHAKSFTDPIKFAANSIAPSAATFLSAKDYVDQFMDLTFSTETDHALPMLILSWGKDLKFQGFLCSCEAEYTKFVETGRPVRAIIHCSFGKTAQVEPEKGSAMMQSPDTSKCHTVEQGERMSDLAREAYDDPAQWRHIAQANGINNPRLMQTGRLLHMPAIK